MFCKVWTFKLKGCSLTSRDSQSDSWRRLFSCLSSPGTRSRSIHMARIKKGKLRRKQWEISKKKCQTEEKIEKIGVKQPWFYFIFFPVFVWCQKKSVFLAVILFTRYRIAMEEAGLSSRRSIFESNLSRKKTWSLCKPAGSWTSICRIKQVPSTRVMMVNLQVEI